MENFMYDPTPAPVIPQAPQPQAWPTVRYADPSSQYWSFDDPRWRGRLAEANPYPILQGELWEQLLRQSGFSGPMYEGRVASPYERDMWLRTNYPQYGDYIRLKEYYDREGWPSTGEQFTPQARAAIDALRAQGYDIRQKHPDRDTYNTYFGIFGPQGLIQDIKIEGNDGSRNFLKFLTAVGGGILGSGALGNVFGGGATNALAGVPGEIAAGGALEGIGSVSGNIIGASGAPIAALPAVGGALTAADLANMPTSVLGGGETAGAAGDVLAGSAGDVVDPEMQKLLRQQEIAQGGGSALGGIGPGATSLPGMMISGSAAGDLVDRALNLINTPAGQAVLGAAGSVVGGVMEANAAEKAAETQSQAAQNALALQREMFEYQKSLLEPYRTAGTKALERLSGAMGLGGPGSQRQMLEMDPGYGFRLGEGLKALERMQVSRGNFLSGGALKAGQRFAQDTASQEYGNAYNRLANIAGLGQTAGTQMGGAAAGFGTSAGNIMGQEANALAAGRAARGSAYSNAIGGALGAYQNYLNRQQEERLIRDIFGRTIGG